MTTGLEHGCDEALAAAADRRDPGGDERRRADRPGRRRARRHRTAARRDPRRARQRLRAGARDPDGRRRGGRRRWPRVTADGSTSARSTASASSASRAAASTPTRTGSPTRRSSIRGNLVYVYAALRALSRGSRPASRSRLDGAAARAARATPSPWPTARPTAAACSSRPTPSSTTACSTWSRPARSASCTSWLNLPKVFKGTHVDNAEVSVARAAEVRIEADRPFAVYADGDHDRGPSRDRARAAARAARDRPRMSAAAGAGRRCSAPSSRSPERPGRSAAAAAAAAAPRCPGRLLLQARAGRDQPPRRRARARARRSISATNGKTTTAGMLAAALRAAGRDPVHNRAGSNMSWGVATALLEQRGAEGLFEVDEAWLPRIAAELDPRLIVLGNLFRDQLDRYGELEHLADEWARAGRRARRARGFVLNADDPLVADLGRDRELRRATGVTYFGIEDASQALPELQHAFDAKHCRRCGAPLRVRARLRRPSRPLRVPELRRRPARARRWRRPRSSCAGCGDRASRDRDPAGRGELELPLPGLYNVYNALAALAAALRLGHRPRRRRSRRSAGDRGGVRARRDDRGARARRSRSC